jgi:hypothetical protein
MAVPRIKVDEAAEAVLVAYRNYELTERRLDELTVNNACYRGIPSPGAAAGFRCTRARCGRWGTTRSCASAPTPIHAARRSS